MISTYCIYNDYTQTINFTLIKLSNSVMIFPGSTCIPKLQLCTFYQVIFHEVLSYSIVKPFLKLQIVQSKILWKPYCGCACYNYTSRSQNTVCMKYSTQTNSFVTIPLAQSFPPWISLLSINYHLELVIWEPFNDQSEKHQKSVILFQINWF